MGAGVSAAAQELPEDVDKARAKEFVTGRGGKWSESEWSLVSVRGGVAKRKDVVALLEELSRVHSQAPHRRGIEMAGEPIAEAILDETRRRAAKLPRRPRLCVVSWGQAEATASSEATRLTADRAGIDLHAVHLDPATTTLAQAANRIADLNTDPLTDAVVVDLPNPRRAAAAPRQQGGEAGPTNGGVAAEDEDSSWDDAAAPRSLTAGISLHKDVDGASAASFGALAMECSRAKHRRKPETTSRPPTGAPPFASCTALACITVLKAHGVRLDGSDVCVVGANTVVGMPLALLLVREGATPTLCHARSAKLADKTRAADIVVVGATRHNLINADMLKPGAVVLDVGTTNAPRQRHKEDGRETPPGREPEPPSRPREEEIVANCSNDVRFTAAAYTPVPGGIGPVATALLLKHVILAAEEAPRK